MKDTEAEAPKTDISRRFNLKKLKTRNFILKKSVYYFGGVSTDGNAKMKDLLGGKGANLSEMCCLGLPVPHGFTITTEVCKSVSYTHLTLPTKRIV